VPLAALESKIFCTWNLPSELTKDCVEILVPSGLVISKSTVIPGISLSGLIKPSMQELSSVEQKTVNGFIMIHVTLIHKD